MLHAIRAMYCREAQGLLERHRYLFRVSADFVLVEIVDFSKCNGELSWQFPIECCDNKLVFTKNDRDRSFRDNNDDLQDPEP